MKKAILFIMTVFLSEFSKSQNLVPNPSFEDTISCPDNLDQVFKAQNWSSYSESPDYYNSCAPTQPFPIVWVPQNYSGYQYASSGVAYIGLFTFYTSPPSYREYIGAQLISPLEIGKKYCVSLMLNLGLNQTMVCASNKLGILFTNSSYSTVTPLNSGNFAHVFSDTIFTDTLNWINLSWEYIPDSAYQYICIGNFFNNSNTDTIQFLPSVIPRAYYLVDDIEVIKCDSTNGISSNNNNNNNVRIAPNPFIDTITIYSTQVINYIFVTDLIGQIVYEKNIKFDRNMQQFTINLNNISSGFYTLNINSNNQTTKYSLQKINN